MRFSVIIPLYNKARYVAKAIGSVLSQSFLDYELIIMDDGSSDDSFVVARTAIDGHDNCRIYQQPNVGVSMARNNAVLLSSGEYLCFLDADDWWAPTFLEEISVLIEDYPEAGIYGTGYTIINETKHKTRIAPVGVDPGFQRGYINYCQVYAKTMTMPLTSISVAVSRSVFNETSGFPRGIKLGEDFLLWIRIALDHKVAFLNKPLAFYNQDADSQWRAVSHLQEPHSHMLWNLGFLEEEEKSNADLKQLIDNLRTYSLLPYYLSIRYRTVARKELDKVDWSKQPEKMVRLYSASIPFLRGRMFILQVGSYVKRLILKFL